MIRDVVGELSDNDRGQLFTHVNPNVFTFLNGIQWSVHFFCTRIRQSKVSDLGTGTDSHVYPENYGYRVLNNNNKDGRHAPTIREGDVE